MSKFDQWKRHFVTGGAGFIGSHLVDRLLSEGKHVTVYDNMVQGRPHLVEMHKKLPNYKFVKADMMDSQALKREMAGHDFVWHFGANADIPGGIEDTMLDLENGTIATRNVLEAMKENGIKHVVYTSSSTVYGELSMSRVAEDMGPMLPISLYGASKLAGEALMTSYGCLFGIQSWIFRFGNVMGGRMNHGVVFDFIQKLIKNSKELEVLGDGNQEKNFFLVEECLQGIYTIVENTNKPFDAFNLGSETTILVKDLAAIVIKEMGLSGVKLKFTGGRSGWIGDVPAVIYNVDKATAAGWKAKHSSAEAIQICTQRLMKEAKVNAQ